jgi:hypothetical protein
VIFAFGCGIAADKRHVPDNRAKAAVSTADGGGTAGIVRLNPDARYASVPLKLRHRRAGGSRTLALDDERVGYVQGLGKSVDPGGDEQPPGSLLRTAELVDGD